MKFTKAKIKHAASVAFLSVLLPTMCVDISPELTLYHKKAKEVLDPVLDITGLWQGTWSLFSKSPDRTNSKVTWICELDNNTVFEGSSPSWNDLSILERWKFFRYMEFYDGIRADKNQAAWGSFATFIKKKCEQSAIGTTADGETDKQQQLESAKALRLSIRRHWATVLIMN